MTESEHYSETLEGFLTRSDSGWFTQLPAVLRAHLARYPELEVQDLYKLLYQAARGSEHAAPDPEAVRLHLTGELSSCCRLSCGRRRKGEDRKNRSREPFGKRCTWRSRNRFHSRCRQ
jgi:hypothetical protein